MIGSFAKLYVAMCISLVMSMLVVLILTGLLIGGVALTASPAKADGVCIPLYPGACQRHASKKPTR